VGATGSLVGFSLAGPGCMMALLSVWLGTLLFSAGQGYGIPLWVRGTATVQFGYESRVPLPAVPVQCLCGCGLYFFWAENLQKPHFSMFLCCFPHIWRDWYTVKFCKKMLWDSPIHVKQPSSLHKGDPTGIRSSINRILPKNPQQSHTCGLGYVPVTGMGTSPAPEACGYTLNLHYYY
jgi:hypothetical protein